MKVSLLIISLCFSITSYCQFSNEVNTKVDLKVELADSINFDIDSILIIGSGASLPRLFLENVSGEMIKKLNSQQVSASYIYLGKNNSDANNEYEMINKKGFKAVLFISPVDTSHILTLVKNQNYYYNSKIFIKVPSYKTSFKQKFSIRLFKSNSNYEKFWIATLNVESDPSKKYASRVVVKKVLENFSENKYIH